ncbi:helix-turn-helix transcriptional regulator [Lactiplantibacillus plantarum]|uniref:helix-turn-helix transcriptional regulator n=1 Tax=Lactiplantibacillus plantarum TaxID=1590 RepID=UPI0021CB5AC1|nr:HTH domain-containing protein [Lactiplantibacillus plantarum]
MKIERLIAIIMLLLENETMSASALAQRFNVTKRTILRDMDTLNLAQIPIYAVRGKMVALGLWPLTSSISASSPLPTYKTSSSP